MIFEGRAEAARRRVQSPLGLRLYMLAKLPLGLAAGLRITRLDASGCTVWLPGGWRTRNPFGSTYFAAQCMAAEMATGAPALTLVRAAHASVAPILREIRGVFVKRIQGRSSFRFDDLGGMKAAIERAAASGESEGYLARVVGATADGAEAARFEVTWSFKRRQ